jgi:aspartyl protease family protein
MSDSDDRWNHEPHGSDGGTGLVWRTARNAAVLVAGCLLVLGFMKWGAVQGGEPGGEPGAEPALEQSLNVGSAPIQIVRTTATGAEMVIRAGRNGHFLVTAEVADVEILFLVDTGASQVILTVEDAERLGHGVDSLEFSDRFETANGALRGAPLLLPGLRIGDLEIEDVRASVIRAPMPTSLLGMSFLSRLEGYEVGEEGLILRW